MVTPWFLSISTPNTTSLYEHNPPQVADAEALLEHVDAAHLPVALGGRDTSLPGRSPPRATPAATSVTRTQRAPRVAAAERTRTPHAAAARGARAGSDGSRVVHRHRPSRGDVRLAAGMPIDERGHASKADSESSSDEYYSADSDDEYTEAAGGRQISFPVAVGPTHPLWA